MHRERFVPDDGIICSLSKERIDIASTFRGECVTIKQMAKSLQNA